LKRDRSAYFFILPAFLFAGIFLFIPLGQGLYLSFFKAGITTREFIGFGNFTGMASDPLFWLALRNTLIIVCGIVVIDLSLSLFIAASIYRLKKVLQSFFRLAFYLPGICAGVVTSMVWLWMFNPTYGLLNYLLSLVGIPPIYWLSQGDTARLAVIIVVCSWFLGGHIILFLAALNAVPETIYEAAKIDGADSIQRFLYITIPLIMPMTVYILVTSTVGAFQIWAGIYMLTAGGPAYATTNMVYRLFQLGFGYFRFGQAAAYGVVLLMIIFPIAFIQFRYLSKKLEF